MRLLYHILKFRINDKIWQKYFLEICPGAKNYRDFMKKGCHQMDGNPFRSKL